MATKARKSKQSRKTSSSKGKNNTKLHGILGAAIDAAEELGHAAEDIKSSWDHVQKARSKGERAMRPARKAGKKVLRAAKSAVRKTKRAVTGKK
jgi:hypothetical protein